MIILEGKRRQLATFIKGAFLGIGASTFLPLRAGEFIKVFFINQKTERSLAKVAFSVIIERFFDVTMLGLLLVSSFFLQRELMRNWLKTFSLGKNFLGQVSLILIVAAVTLVPLGFVILKKTKFRENIGQLKEKLHLLPHRLSRVMLLSCVIWSVDILFVWCMAQGFKASFQLNPNQIVFLFTILATAFLTSIAPGALGIYEFLGLWVLGQFGQPQEKALAFLLAAHGVSFVVLAMATLFVIVEETWIFRTKTEAQNLNLV